MSEQPEPAPQLPDKPEPRYTRNVPMREVAQELRLTEKQRVFCEALAADPERNRTKAALEAGCSVKSASVMGSKWLRLGKVKQYLRVIENRANQRADRKSRHRLMSAAEVQLRLSALARSDLGKHLNLSRPESPSVEIDPKNTYILREVKVRTGGSDKEPWQETSIKVSDPRPALEALSRIYELEKQPNPPQINVAVINEAPPEVKGLLFKALLSANGNGNGHRS